MSAPTELPAARPINLPPTEPTHRPVRSSREGIAAAASTSPSDTAVEDTAAAVDEPDHTGEQFALDLGGSLAPVLLFSVLAGLAVLLGVVADPLPVQIVTGVIAVGAGTLAIRAMTRHNR